MFTYQEKCFSLEQAQSCCFNIIEARGFFNQIFGPKKIKFFVLCFVFWRGMANVSVTLSYVCMVKASKFH